MKPYRLITSLFLALLALPTPSFAASESECAIWLCLPSGFPSGCGRAKSAMKKRIKKRKSPLPRFSSCAVKVKSGSKMSYRHSHAVAIQNYTSSEIRYIKDKTCSGGGYISIDTRIERCIGLRRYIDVFIDGKNAGETYYY